MESSKNVVILSVAKNPRISSLPLRLPVFDHLYLFQNCFSSGPVTFCNVAQSASNSPAKTHNSASEADYIAFNIPNKSVINYDMDFGKRYRGVHDIRIFPPKSQRPLINAQQSTTGFSGIL
jgi:hypothetical protein